MLSEEQKIYNKQVDKLPKTFSIDQIFKKGELPTFLREYVMYNDPCVQTGSCKTFDFFVITKVFSFWLYIRLKNNNTDERLGFISSFYPLNELYKHYNIERIEDLITKESQILKEASYYRSCKLPKVKNPSLEELEDVFPNNIQKRDEHCKSILYEELKAYLEPVSGKDHQQYGLKVLRESENLQKGDKLFNSWCCNFSYWQPENSKHIKFVSLPGCSVTGLNHVFNCKTKELYLWYSINTIFDFYVYYNNPTTIKYVLLVKGKFMEEGYDTFENILKESMVEKMFKLDLENEEIVGIEKIF